MLDEGSIAVSGGRVWFRTVGTGPGVPLLTLHGGPGVPHDYLEPLARLGDDRPVIFYDQLGCGRSERPVDADLWTLERAVEEVGQVINAMQLEQFHLFGHSWGTMLAVEAALTQPAGLRSLILASPVLSVRRWLADCTTHLAALPDEVKRVIKAHEANGTTDSLDYELACAVYMRRHGCRMDPIPDALSRSVAGLGQEVYTTMWGPNEWTATGVLRGYERADRLGELAVPVLFTCGQFDDASPASTSWYRSLTPRSELATFSESSHLPHLEEEAAYLATVRDFLTRVDQDSA